MAKIEQLIPALRMNRDFMDQVVAWEKIPARSARFANLPDIIDPRVTAALQNSGIERVYNHQAKSVEASLHGDNVVIATRTASGKSLCYSIPILHTLLTKPGRKALLLFPTKALAHDQTAAMQELISAGRLPLTVASYDGDTPRSKRSQVRKSADILITNPDMLHAGILPFHTNWRDFFRNLDTIVIDEIHAYRGVFGSHVANVMRRLMRICKFYKASPKFICCSATIANPAEHAERLTEQSFITLSENENGAPRGQKAFILYNPPIIDGELGLRASLVLTAKDAAASFIRQDVQTAVFARARNTVELLLTYLRDEVAFHEGDADTVTGYRGGYLPLERREIETGLRDGKIRGVVATNALELGVDIGQLDAVIISGYPGSIASVWQQAGRSGRRSGESLALMILGNGPLDQYIANHPRYLFGGSPEHALINPDNLRMLVKHLCCAAYEIPLRPGEPYGSIDNIDELLEAMEEMGMLHRTSEKFHWLGDGESPASKVSLRTSGSDTVVIQTDQIIANGDVVVGSPTVIGEVDLESAARMVHEGAIYMHRADSYQVEHLDWENQVAHVIPQPDADFYTRSSINSNIAELRELVTDGSNPDLLRAHGEVLVITKATGYRIVKRYTHETLGFGDIDLPEIELDTMGYWMIFSEELTERLYDAGILLRPNDYGPNWKQQRLKVLDRDKHACRTCGATDTLLHVHHIRPFREFFYVPGENENYLDANRVENLVTLCPSCHRAAEEGQQARSAMGGLAYLLRNLAPLFLMCDPSDIQVTAESRSPLTGAPTIVIYEQIAAGIGFSEKLFEIHIELLAAGLELVSTCKCQDGCPACVGPPGEIGPNTKAVTRKLLKILSSS
ncbi:MAG: DEAD/DEAH box helicase [Chloroflexota bacterium]